MFSYTCLSKTIFNGMVSSFWYLPKFIALEKYTELIISKLQLIISKVSFLDSLFLKSKI